MKIKPIAFVSTLTLLAGLCACERNPQGTNSDSTGTDSRSTTNSTTTTPSTGTTTTTPARDSRTQPDNTRNNEVDRNTDTKTPVDQSESATDVKITAEIRRAIMEDKSMSVNAQNVKIITDKSGVVTLRGVVATQAEKDAIQAKAQAVAGVTRVDNQLEIKPN